jgi:hypothetical protein
MYIYIYYFNIFYHYYFLINSQIIYKKKRIKLKKLGGKAFRFNIIFSFLQNLALQRLNY